MSHHGQLTAVPYDDTQIVPALHSSALLQIVEIQRRVNLTVAVSNKIAVRRPFPFSIFLILRLFNGHAFDGKWTAGAPR